MGPSDTVMQILLGMLVFIAGGVGSAALSSQLLDWYSCKTADRRISSSLTGDTRTVRRGIESRLLQEALGLLSFIPQETRDSIGHRLRSLDPRRRARAHQFVRQLPDALDQIAQALGAGLSLPQAVQRASQYLPDPIGSQLLKVHAHMSISHSFEQSFLLMGEEFDCQELRLVCSGIAVQTRLGGNMKKMLQQSARYCRQTQALERSLNAQTAQSRLSLKVIMGAPFILCAVLSVMMPSFTGNLLFTATGRTLLITAIGLDVIGFLWARRILRVEGIRD